MVTLIDHAVSELALLSAAQASQPDHDPAGPAESWERLTHDAALSLVRLFSEAGHSGASAAHTLALFTRLARFEPLTPLTSDPAEWNLVGGSDDRPTHQSRRCPNVFRDADTPPGPAYTLDGFVFREPSGACFTGRHSRRSFDLPGFPPETIYVNVPDEATDDQKLAAIQRALAETPTDSLSALQASRVAFNEAFEPQVEPPLTDVEYALRFLEESLELAQAAGVPVQLATAQLCRTYSRPVGDVPQEAADAMVNLLGVAVRFGFDLSAVTLSTIAACSEPARLAQIASRQTAKREALDNILLTLM